CLSLYLAATSHNSVRQSNEAGVAARHRGEVRRGIGLPVTVPVHLPENPTDDSSPIHKLTQGGVAATE
ncbi:MAG: hypothetical protein ACP5MD_15195, partial [Verrucomicrobiia bacterium]